MQTKTNKCERLAATPNVNEILLKIQLEKSLANERLNKRGLTQSVIAVFFSDSVRLGICNLYRFNAVHNAKNDFVNVFSEAKKQKKTDRTTVYSTVCMVSHFVHTFDIRSDAISLMACL